MGIASRPHGKQKPFRATAPGILLPVLAHSLLKRRVDPGETMGPLEATIANHAAARPTRTQNEPFTLVIMEHGSDWPAALDGGPAACVALKQEPSEPAPCLLHRAIHRIRSLERTDGVLERIVLSCGDEGSRTAVLERRTLAQGLLEAAVRNAEKGRLELVACSRASATMKQSLVALVGVLSQGLAGTHASIGVRFAATEPRHETRRGGAAHRMQRRRAA